MSCSYNRLRIGHTHLTHSFLLKSEDPTECIGCQTPLTVEHILMNGIDFQPTRQQYYTSPNLSELFKNVPSRTMVDFIKKIELYWKLRILKGVTSNLKNVSFNIIHFSHLSVFYWYILYPFTQNRVYQVLKCHEIRSGTNSHIALMCSKVTNQTV